MVIRRLRSSWVYFIEFVGLFSCQAKLFKWYSPLTSTSRKPAASCKDSPSCCSLSALYGRQRNGTKKTRVEYLMLSDVLTAWFGSLLQSVYPSISIPPLSETMTEKSRSSWLARNKLNHHKPVSALIGTTFALKNEHFRKANDIMLEDNLKSDDEPDIV